MQGAHDVLVVDDEPNVLEVTRRILQMDGLAATLCTRGEDAVALVEAGARFRLALLDVVMPGLSGVEIARRLRAIQPDLPIAFVTGSLNVDRLPLGDCAAELLQKPFSPTDMRRLVGRHIERAQV